MSKIKLTKVAFKGTAEQEKELRAKLAGYKTLKGGLMPALQTAQDIYGYLPIEVQKIIAEELNVPLEEIFGVATFYSQFTLNPQGKTQFTVCLGTACYVKGSGGVIEKLQEILKIEPGDVTPDGRFSLNATRCIGCCGLAPVMVVGDKVFAKVLKEEVPKLVQPYLKAE